jgi:hypothetical protein
LRIFAEANAKAMKNFFFGERDLAWDAGKRLF